MSPGGIDDLAGMGWTCRPGEQTEQDESTEPG